MQYLYDSSLSADSLQGLRELIRQSYDSTINSDASSEIKVLMKYMYDSSVSSDSLQNLKELIRNMYEITANSDNSIARRETIQYLYDYSMTTDSAQNLKELLRQIYDATANSDMNVKTNEIIRFVYDYSTSTDSVQNLKELIRNLYDVSNSNDLSINGRELLRNLYDLTSNSENMNYTTEITILKNIIEIFYDSTASSDAPDAYKEFVRNIYDQSQASDSLQKQRELLQSIMDYTSSSDTTPNPLKELYQAWSESVINTDVIEPVMRELTGIFTDATNSVDDFIGWLTCQIGICPTGGSVVIITGGGGGGGSTVVYQVLDVIVQNNRIMSPGNLSFIVNITNVNQKANGTLTYWIENKLANDRYYRSSENVSIGTLSSLILNRSIFIAMPMGNYYLRVSFENEPVQTIIRKDFTIASTSFMNNVPFIEPSEVAIMIFALALMICLAFVVFKKMSLSDT